VQDKDRKYPLTDPLMQVDIVLIVILILIAYFMDTNNT